MPRQIIVKLEAYRSPKSEKPPLSQPPLISGCGLGLTEVKVPKIEISAVGVPEGFHVHPFALDENQMESSLLELFLVMEENTDFSLTMDSPCGLLSAATRVIQRLNYRLKSKSTRDQNENSDVAV